MFENPSKSMKNLFFINFYSESNILLEFAISMGALHVDLNL